jgi:3-deoxy-D-manno-octulosonate 8-phosphate phosphatase KdsC-like HAD superfamily phosphatase
LMKKNGGEGCVREFVEMVLKKTAEYWIKPIAQITQIIGNK